MLENPISFFRLERGSMLKAAMAILSVPKTIIMIETVCQD